MELALLRSPDLSARLADRIALLGASRAPLTNTPGAYVAHHQDRRETARELYIHPNTLDDRLRRVRELTGLNPVVPRRRGTRRGDGGL